MDWLCFVVCAWLRAAPGPEEGGVELRLSVCPELSLSARALPWRRIIFFSNFEKFKILYVWKTPLATFFDGKITGGSFFFVILVRCAPFVFV